MLHIVSHFSTSYQIEFNYFYGVLLHIYEYEITDIFLHQSAKFRNICGSLFV